MVNFYELLGVSHDASNEQIKKAFLEKAKISHPDVNNGSQSSHEYYLLLSKAKETLLDSNKRLEHDYVVGIKMKPGAAIVNRSNNEFEAFAAGALITLGLIALFSGSGNKS